MGWGGEGHFGSLFIFFSRLLWRGLGEALNIGSLEMGREFRDFYLFTGILMNNSLYYEFRIKPHNS
jgi:hypothetical protein